jgi:thiol-disulfide isomerase/thioredoxin
MNTLRSTLRSWKYWPWLRDAAFMVAFLLAVRAYQSRDVPTGAAPELVGVDLRGERASLADYRGNPVLLHFWASWCGVCKAEQSNLDALARELPVLSVASQSGAASAVAAYVREHAIAPRVVVDADGGLARAFGVRAFPTTFVIDARGKIRYVEVGYTTVPGLRARLWLAGR